MIGYAAGFHRALWAWIYIIIGAAPLFAISDYIQDRLKIEWRKWLSTEMLRGYYANRAYYVIHQRQTGLDNPDQVLSPFF